MIRPPQPLVFGSLNTPCSPHFSSFPLPSSSHEIRCCIQEAFLVPGKGLVAVFVKQIHALAEDMAVYLGTSTHYCDVLCC